MIPIIWAAVLVGAFWNGRIDDRDFHDPEEFLPERDKFSAAPAALPKMGWED